MNFFCYLLFRLHKIASTALQCCNHKNEIKDLKNIKYELRTLNLDLKMYLSHVNLKKFDSNNEPHLDMISNKFINDITRNIEDYKEHKIPINQIEKYIVKKKRFNDRERFILFETLKKTKDYLYDFKNKFDLNIIQEYRELSLTEKNQLALLFIVNDAYKKNIITRIDKILNYLDQLN